MSEIKLFLLGPPRLERDERPLRVRRRKGLALLSYLAVTGEPQRRETLMTMLWPESEPSLVQSYLRRDLAVLSKALGQEWLDADRESVSLARREGFWLDAEQFRRLLAACQTHDHPADAVCARCLPLLEQAVEMYRGDFMAGFTLPDSPDFDEWQFFEGEELRRELAGALARLVQGHSTQGEFLSALPYARRWLATEPWHEPAHRQLMRLYAWSGNFAAALRQYEECVRVLQEELGQAPEEATQKLYESVRVRRPPEPPCQEEAPGKVDARLESPRPRHNLPLQFTPFVGREQELAEIDRLLQDPTCRLLTLVGPGGIGKSRLALQAAEQALDHFPDGVYLVSLASVDVLELVVPTIAEALNLAFQGRPDVKDQLLDYLREKVMLLVLDNLEQLLSSPPLSPPLRGGCKGGGMTLLSELLTVAPGIKILATSRERLNLRVEWVQEMRGLPFPSDGIPTGVEPSTLEAYPAVQLFLEHARRVRPGFLLSATDWVAVARICQLVEGTPLGLELAAAWVRLMPCPEIVREIQRDLDFLTTSWQDVPERHRSLGALFEHSWRLLSEQEREVMIRLTVFQGGFLRAAAGPVTDASLALLAALTDKSMLRVDASGRYDMQGLFQQHVNERLQERPEESQRVQDRHCSYYTTFLQTREPDLRGASQQETLSEIAAEIDNVRAAWRWAVTHGKAVEIGQGLESLHLFYFARSWYEQGEEAFRGAAQALRAAADSPTLVLGKLLARQGRFAYRLGMDQEARELLQESLAIFDRLQAELEGMCPAARMASAFPLYHMSEIARGDGDFQEAERLCLESLGIYRERDDRLGMARALNHLGIIAALQGAYEEAQGQIQQALELYRATGDPYGIANTLNDLGIVADRRGQHEEAERMHRECLAMRRQIGHVAGIGASLNNLGYFAYLRGEYAAARQLLEESLVIQREIGDRHEIANCLSNLGAAVFALGEPDACRQLFEEALRIAFDVQHVPLVLEVLTGIATLLAAGEQEKAAELFDLARRHPASDKPTQDRAKRGLAELAAELSPAVLAAARERRHTGELEQVVAEILGAPRSLPQWGERGCVP